MMHLFQFKEKDVHSNVPPHNDGPSGGMCTCESGNVYVTKLALDLLLFIVQVNVKLREMEQRVKTLVEILSIFMPIMW